MKKAYKSVAFLILYSNFLLPVSFKHQAKQLVVPNEEYQLWEAKNYDNHDDDDRDYDYDHDNGDDSDDDDYAGGGGDDNIGFSC